MPIIAGRASAAYGAGFGAITTPPFQLTEGSFDFLSFITAPSGGLADVTFESIPQGYKHLQIRTMENITNANNDQGYGSMRFNGDTTGSYSRHQFTTNQSSASSFGLTGQTNAVYGYAYLVNATSSFMCTNIIDILDYSHPSKTTIVKGLSGMEFNGSGFMGLFSSVWAKTEPVTSIRIFNTTGAFRVNSTFALYGVR